jgi:hypothetical protein
MNATPLLQLLICSLLALGANGVATAQDKGRKSVVSEDLGGGFRAVSVNGGPPAIVDDETGLILKSIKGRPAVVDKEAGAFMFLSDEGKTVVKYYGKKKGRRGSSNVDPKKLERMKAFMKRVRKHSEALGRIHAGGKGGKKGLKKPNKKSPAETLEDRLAFCLKLLAVSPEEAAVIKPLLGAILVKQDQIRRSTLNPSARRPKTDDLPAAIQTFLTTLREGLVSLKGQKTPENDARLEKGLPAYRAARAQQGKELEVLREKLREALTVLQEAKLAAVGVLD